MRPPDPDRSRVVLIGNGRFDSRDLPELPTVRNNVTALAQVLTEPWTGLFHRRSVQIQIDAHTAISYGSIRDLLLNSRAHRMTAPPSTATTQPRRAYPAAAARAASASSTVNAPA